MTFSIMTISIMAEGHLCWVSHTCKPFRLNDVMLNVIRLIVVAPKKTDIFVVF
jgi:hypothetical protein